MTRGSLWPALLATVLAVGLVIAGCGGGEDEAQPPADPVFETIDDDDIQAEIGFRRLDPAETPGVLSQDDLRQRLGAALIDRPMRESPKLVELTRNPFPNTPGTDGPLWALLPDIPILGGAPAGVETFVLELYDARSGAPVLEYGGPIINGENEWHPDFPEELRYDREDQIR